MLKVEKEIKRILVIKPNWDGYKNIHGLLSVLVDDVYLSFFNKINY